MACSSLWIKFSFFRAISLISKSDLLNAEDITVAITTVQYTRLRKAYHLTRSWILNNLMEEILTKSNNKMNYKNMIQQTMSKTVSNASHRITKHQAKLRKYNYSLIIH